MSYHKKALALYANVVKNGHPGPDICQNAPKAPSIKGYTIPNPSKVSLPRADAVMKIDRQIELFSTTPSTPVEAIAHQVKLSMAEKDFRKMLCATFPEAQIWLTGSFAAGIELATSDLDFTLKIPTLEVEGNHKLEVLKEKMVEAQNLFKVLNVVRGKIWVLKLIHKATNTEVDVTIDNEPPKRNTQLLLWYSQMDRRCSLLMKSVKQWGSRTGVENSREGRLNSFTLCLMTIHYLQVVKVLPNLQELFPELNGEEIEIPADETKRRNLAKEIEMKKLWKRDEEAEKMSLGALYMGFFEYYSGFDFKNRYISVRSGAAVEEIRSGYGFMIVEDPFLVPRHNCAGTVRVSTIQDRIVQEFQKQLARTQTGSIACGHSVRRSAIVAVGKEKNAAEEGSTKRCGWTIRNVVDWDENRPSDYERWEEWPANIRIFYG